MTEEKRKREEILVSKVEKLEERLKELTYKIEELELHKRNLHKAIQIKNRKIDDLCENNEQLGNKIKKYESCVQMINTLVN